MILENSPQIEVDNKTETTDSSDWEYSGETSNKDVVGQEAFPFCCESLISSSSETVVVCESPEVEQSSSRCLPLEGRKVGDVLSGLLQQRREYIELHNTMPGLFITGVS